MTRPARSHPGGPIREAIGRCPVAGGNGGEGTSRAGGGGGYKGNGEGHLTFGGAFLRGGEGGRFSRFGGGAARAVPARMILSFEPAAAAGDIPPISAQPACKTHWVSADPWLVSRRAPTFERVASERVARGLPDDDDRRPGDPHAVGDHVAIAGIPGGAELGLEQVLAAEGEKKAKPQAGGVAGALPDRRTA